jgi:CheY-like chemotaxis protein
MTKVMLVEDDNNLREIYEARLLAEGFEIISAKDGEEALALAVKEKPELIVADIMMPKISGFDMLDILRSTPETKNTKVIMMTALSQAEDKNRAEKLGADRYLIKSQVTLEDVARVVQEVINGVQPKQTSSGEPTNQPVVVASTVPAAAESAAPSAPAASDQPAEVPANVTPTEETAEPTNNPVPSADSTGSPSPKVIDPAGLNSTQAATQPTESNVIEPNAAAKEPEPSPPPEAAKQPSVGQKVIEPLTAANKPTISELLDQENAKEEAAPAAPEGAPPASTVIAPGGENVTPPPGADKKTDESSDTPGNVVHPNGGNDPSSIAL